MFDGKNDIAVPVHVVNMRSPADGYASCICCIHTDSQCERYTPDELVDE